MKRFVPSRKDTHAVWNKWRGKSSETISGQPTDPVYLENSRLDGVYVCACVCVSVCIVLTSMYSISRCVDNSSLCHCFIINDKQLFVYPIYMYVSQLLPETCRIPFISHGALLHFSVSVCSVINYPPV